MHSRKFFILLVIFISAALLGVLAHKRAFAAVTISSFSAKWQGSSVVVNWRTGSELNNVGFNILRSTSANGTFTKVNYTPAQFGSIAGASYAFTDSAVTPGTTYYYRLQSVDTSGKVDTYSQTVSAQAPATPTATATATRTRTPTNTATRVPNAPTATTAPPTATATTPPQFTPTRTRTLPPGVPSPTPPPPTPTARRVAYAVQPSATRAQAPAIVVSGTATPEPPRIAVAIKEAESDQAEEIPDEETSTAANENDVRMRQLIFGVLILGMGVMGTVGLGLGIFAIYLAFRPRP